MHPTLEHHVMSARTHDKMASAAQHRLAAEAKAARRARRDQMRDQTVAEPRLRGLRRVWGLLPLPA